MTETNNLFNSYYTTTYIDSILTGYYTKNETDFLNFNVGYQFELFWYDDNLSAKLLASDFFSLNHVAQLAYR